MNHRVPNSSQCGFTLVEMLVVLAIMGVVLAVTITGQRSFDGSIVLSNTAYDIALSIRQAQTYGVSGRIAQGTSSATYGYGIDVQSLPTDKYVLFADTHGTGCNATISSITSAPDTKTGDCTYTSGSDIKVQSVQINNSVTISGACVYKNIYAYCSFGTTAPSQLLSQVDISFARPEPGAIIYAKNAAGVVFKNAGSNIKFDHACLRLSAGGSDRYVMVNQVGIISVISAASAATSCKGL